MKSLSDTQFYLERDFDGFSNLKVDAQKVYDQFPIPEMERLEPIGLDSFEKFLKALYATPFLPLKFRLFLWRFAFRSHLDLEWFKSFTSYWTQILGARPLWSPHDFYFLKNVYRSKFQNITLPDTEDPSVHLGAWQRPELLYQFMHLITKETAPVDALLVKQVKKLLSSSDNLRLLEFGCGTAPITLSAIRFWAQRGRHHYYIADIDTLAFHYSSYYFRGNNNVTALQLKRSNNFRLELEESLDAIFCIQVLEHLNQPLATVQGFTDLLRPGGILVFDFIKTEGEGLDTIQAVRERDEVLRFIQQNYRFENRATVDSSKTIDMTLAVKL